MTSSTLTRRELSLGAFDSVTGWPRRVYTESTITGSIQLKGASFNTGQSIYFSRYDHTAYIPDVIHEGDQIEDAQGNIYELNTVGQLWWLDQFQGYQCEAVLKQFEDRAATSGTWHTDTATLTTDPRSRHKIYLDTYLNTANIAGDYLTMFDGLDFPIKYLFNDDLGLDLDLVFIIGKEPAVPRLDAFHVPYAFEETVPITIYAVNKSGVTATNLIEQAEQEIRRIVTTYPLGGASNNPFRSITTTKHSPMDLGDRNFLWSTTVAIKYVRSNYQYTPVLPYITYGTSGSGTNYIFPNVVNINYPGDDIGDGIFKMPSRVGDYTEILGTGSLMVEITCDLDIEPWNGSTSDTRISWKRPQTTGTKTDAKNYQVFLDIWHNSAITQPYQTLALDWGCFNVRLAKKPNIRLEGGRHLITLTFREYNPTDTSTLTYEQRWGIS